MDRLEIFPLENVSRMFSFSCGEESMDEYIRNGLQQSIEAHFCKAFEVKCKGEIVAFFALNFDSLELDCQEAYDILHRKDNPIEIALEYEDVFKNKHSYPAIEISFLAVRNDVRNSGIGSAVLSEIIRLGKAQPIAGCQFITVMAYYRKGYSAAGFYKKKGFTKIKGGGKETIRMFLPLYVWKEIQDV